MQLISSATGKYTTCCKRNRGLLKQTVAIAGIAK